MRACTWFFIALVFGSTLTVAAEDAWRSGKLLSFRQDTINSFSNGTSHREIVYDIEVDAGEKVLYGEDTLRFRWNKAPVLTENAPIQYRLSGRDIEFQDESGKKYKVKLLKQRVKEISPSN